MTAALAVTPLEGVDFRRIAFGDVPFVSHSWLKSYWEATVEDTGVPHGRYCAQQHAAIQRLLQRGECLMATSADDTTHLWGFVAYEVPEGSPPVVHYVYVKHAFRRMGVASALLEQATGNASGLYTHHTRAGRSLAERFFLSYSPESAQ